MILDKLASPILFKGDEYTAYRDPAVIYHQGVFYLYFTLVKTIPGEGVFLHLAMSKSSDLINFSPIRLLTPKDKSLNYSSPGNVIRFNSKWYICFQTYPRQNGEKFGNSDARIWTMCSDDLENWSSPKILKVKGPEVPVEEMGRMIDPYLLEDKDIPGKWWCFYKQNGVSISCSDDLENWTYYDHSEAGENVCVIINNNEYILFHSPENGIGVMSSKDLKKWNNSPEIITLGQDKWDWAKGRLTAGFVLDCRAEENIGKYLMFFHGTGPENEEIIFDTHACIGIAWSDDLKTWNWPC